MERDLFGVLEMSFYSLWNDVLAYLPSVLIALIVLIVGWIIAGSLKVVIESIFAKLKVNDALDKAGVDVLAQKAGYKLKAGVFVGTLVKWFVILVFFVAALEILNLDQVTIFFRDVVLGYLPKVIVSVLILLVSTIVANVASASVVAGARAAEIKTAEMLGTITRYSILVFAVLAVLSQLNIAAELVNTLFMGIVFAASLAVGLAFGLGGKEAASRYIAEMTGKGGGHGGHNHH
jgi:hypothetical protein